VQNPEDGGSAVLRNVCTKSPHTQCSNPENHEFLIYACFYAGNVMIFHLIKSFKLSYYWNLNETE